MAAKVSKLESEIEKQRVCSNWSKAFELSKHTLLRTPHFQTISKLLLAEKHIEEHLQEYPPLDKNIPVALKSLTNAKTILEELLHSKVQPSIALEVHMLLCKLLFAQGNYQAALKVFEEGKIDQVVHTGQTARTLRLLAESYAIKGRCLEKVSVAKEDDIIAYYEKAGDLSIKQLQERDRIAKVTPSGESTIGGVSSVLETAIQRSSILHIQKGRLSKGIGQFRELLTAVETRSTQSMRMTLARQLAEVLLKGTCQANYKPPADNTKHTVTDNLYKHDSVFCPKNRDEEAILLLLIGEALSSRDAVLERTVQHKEAREQSFHNATAIYDLLTITLVKQGQYEMIADVFEKSLKFSFDEFHIWYQLGLSLMSSGKYHRALLVLSECSKLQPDNATVCLLAARICYDHLHLLEDGISYSRRVIDQGDCHPGAGRGYLSLGVGYSLQSTEVKMQTERHRLQTEALQAFQRAHELDKNDHLTLYHLALQYALLRQVSQAVHYVQEALKNNSEHIHSLHLLALLFSAQNRHQEALEVIKVATAEYPDNFSLLFTKCHLEEVCLGVETALCTSKAMLQIWKELYDHDQDSESPGTGLIDKLINERRSLAHITLSEYGDKDSGSVRESLAASRVEQALSEVASSVNSIYTPQQGHQQSWVVQTHIWLHLAELYLALDKCNEATACVREAASIVPLSHYVAYMRGRIHEQKLEYLEAKMQYLNAISINPYHTKTLHHLGCVYHSVGNDLMAEKVLRDAVNIDPMSHNSWRELAIVLQSMGESESAAECLMTAINLDTSSPIIPFTILPRSLQL